MTTATRRRGAWTSPYDGETWTDPSDIDIDHLREAFANDMTRPELIAVTDNVNQSKSDSDPAEWMPPRRAYWCTYAAGWVEVKHFYELTIDAEEKRALEDTLARC